MLAWRFIRRLAGAQDQCWAMAGDYLSSVFGNDVFLISAIQVNVELGDSSGLELLQLLDMILGRPQEVVAATFLDIRRRRSR